MPRDGDQRTGPRNVHVVTMTDVRRSTAAVLHRVKGHEETLLVVRRKRPLVAIVPVTNSGRTKFRLPFTK